MILRDLRCSLLHGEQQHQPVDFFPRFWQPWDDVVFSFIPKRRSRYCGFVTHGSSAGPASGAQGTWAVAAGFFRARTSIPIPTLAELQCAHHVLFTLVHDTVTESTPTGVNRTGEDALLERVYHLVAGSGQQWTCCGQQASSKTSGRRLSSVPWSSL